MYRLWRIFNTSIVEKVKITDNQLFLKLFVVLIIEVALLLLWTFLMLQEDPSTTVRYEYYAGVYLKQFACASGPTVPVVLILVYNGCIFLCGCYFSFTLRHAPSNFKDREFVTVSMSVLGFGAVVLIPATQLLTSRSVIFLLQSLGVILITTFTIAMYGIPKMLHGLGILELPDEMDKFINKKKHVQNCPVCGKQMKSASSTISFERSASSQSIPQPVTTHPTDPGEQRVLF
eukprot:TRINITY_DN5815_c0_g1_i1.p1 TRINITY_DN5815_c0_g1~~TRINITY_DN5815_c0_g1_i1.p1  ORF type:complete len:272 (+),score=43.54 TRINITY_DN5815_c0_g1_i1:123-818(+)